MIDISITDIINAIKICFVAILIIKNKVALNNRNKILNAIEQYNTEQIHNGVFTKNGISYSQLEPYYKTFLRLWDYGYKNIVPKEIYIRIEPYLK